MTLFGRLRVSRATLPQATQTLSLPEPRLSAAARASHPFRDPSFLDKSEYAKLSTNYRPANLRRISMSPPLGLEACQKLSRPPVRRVWPALAHGEIALLCASVPSMSQAKGVERSTIKAARLTTVWPRTASHTASSPWPSRTCRRPSWRTRPILECFGTKLL